MQIKFLECYSVVKHFKFRLYLIPNIRPKPISASLPFLYYDQYGNKTGVDKMLDAAMMGIYEDVKSALDAGCDVDALSPVSHPEHACVLKYLLF